MHTAARAYQTVSSEHQREQLILGHLDYVRHILGKLAVHLPRGVDRENLESAGMLGLVEAAQQYDAQRGVAFKTFAYNRIRGAILDELRRNSPLPQKLLQHVARIRAACEVLPPPAAPEDIARQSGLSLGEVEQALEAMRLCRVDGSETAAHWNSLPDQRATRPGAELEKAEAVQVVADGIENLPKQERLAITLYYLEDLRMKEIGAVLNLSESRVSRLLAKAEFRLEQYVRARGAR